jgi:hypothetical protein
LILRETGAAPLGTFARRILNSTEMEIPRLGASG